MRRAILAVVLLTACAKKQPDVLLVTFDTTRADRVGFVSGRAGVTPTLDALAKSGTVFTTAIASQPLTAPSHATILTGLHPYQHGVRNNGAYTLDAKHVSIAERLRDAGYATHAIVSAYVLDSRFGFDQGFDGYDDDLTGGRELDARRVADKALRWLQTRNNEQPFFLWLHFYDPHGAYTPPPDIARRFDPYSGEIHYADRELGRVVEALRGSETLIVFTADHGESLGEHGEKGHGLFVYDATTRVPLLFTGPGVPRGRKSDAVASHVDLMPTILDVLGLEDHPSLLATTSPPRRAYSETFAGRMNFGWSELRTMRSDTARVIDAPKRESYRVPDQSRNLYGPDLSRDARAMFAELAKIATTDDFRRTATPVDEESRRKLAALGYITSTTPATAEAHDPKDRIGAWEAYSRAQTLLRAHDFAAAVHELRTLQTTEPASNAVASLLTQALAQNGQRDAAMAVIKEAIEREPENVAFITARAELLRDAGQFEEAELLLRDVLRRDPNAGSVAAALGDVLNRAGKTPEALQTLEDARRRDPSNHLVAYNLGVVYEKMQRWVDAIAMYRAAIALDPQHSMSWNNLGSVLARNGRRDEAIAAVAKARALDVQNVEAMYNLGALLLDSGRAREAVPLLEEASRRRPELLAARVRFAHALERMGQTKRALAAWRDAARVHPRAWVKVAELELRLGNRDAARAALDRGIALVGAPMTDAARRDPALRELIAPR
ncbi:MAG TPA: sulfatase-like hydrolase/transferase [Thermoanaerobaculia bacterium]|nr:sulfatase-like hydrolase/transferase [Thermoanaerobaculia bacterium]